jgi:putative spermidine/putrescine transport system ATP-binding protein
VRLDDGELIDAVPVNVSAPASAPRLDPARAGGVQPRGAAGGRHTVEAEVLEFIYMGDMFRTRLRVAGNDDFVIKSATASASSS